MSSSRGSVVSEPPLGSAGRRLRLLQLPMSVRRMLQEGQLTLGHARALLALGNERLIVDVAREVVAKGLTVRHVEQRARLNTPEAERRRAKVSPAGAGKSRNPEAR